MRNCLILACLLSFPILAADAVEQDQPATETLYVRRIAPLLREKCLGCHGDDPETIEGGLDLRTAAAMLSGGDSDESPIRSEEPNQSPLLLAVERQSGEWSPMPPKEAEQLAPHEIEWLRQWVAGGATWPSPKRQAEIEAEYGASWSTEDGIRVATSGGLDDEWTNRRYMPESLWAYQPVQKPVVPEDANAIDWLLDQATPAGLAKSQRADRSTLLRRATFDLTGLPPTPDEIAEFTSDTRTEKVAFAAVVERLLSSPHYGERMAQHWLDVARYADSSGLANDYERGNAWRYRDYVIRSFNNDKPYDQFIREQIAGDELEPNNPESMIATGFLRMGPWELTGMEVAKVARQRFLDDVTNSVGEVFLAHSLQCARCHDHKFDPVPTRDYYSFQAVFANTQLAEGQAAFLETENTTGFEEQRYLQKRRNEYNAKLSELDTVLLKNADDWFIANQLSSAKWDAAIAEARANKVQRLFNAGRKAMQKQNIPEDQFPPKLVDFTPEQFGMERLARKGLQRLSWELERYKPFALTVYNGRTPSSKSIAAPTRIPKHRLTQGELEQTCILTGGDPFSPATSVEPGALSVLKSVPPISIDRSLMDGKRTALAEWISNPKNCLTTRVIVNRIWMWHFQKPIAGNPNNFGSTGKRPTHPKLLDWLAATFLEEDWSMKALHRRIMNSEAYCRSSLHPNHEALTEKDPNRTSYASFTSRRLSAEEMRDAMLCITGELNDELGGIPNRPEINSEVALQPRQIMGSFAAAWVPNPLPQQRHRRSIYSLKLRGLADPMMQVFNSPSRDFSCEMRSTSTVTPQAFSLFNGKATHARALAFAKRMLDESDDDRGAIQLAFSYAYARTPTAEETRDCLAHWQQIERDLDEYNLPTPEPPPREVVREAIEENTGEPFSYSERLYANDDFVPDLQSVDVSEHVQAFADVCLVILNSNEFVYID